jgi:hypoxanthine phosphoribosyltransferase
MQGDLERILFDETAIHQRLDEIAADITRDYQGHELTVIAILNGSLIFAADLLRRIELPLRLDCLNAATYRGGTKPANDPVVGQINLHELEKRHVLILDDILDSGMTLTAVREKIGTAMPVSIRTCVLLEKAKTTARPIAADYIGFTIADEFVVGYGLDYLERYRNLRYVGVLRKDLIAETES